MFIVVWGVAAGAATTARAQAPARGGERAVFGGGMGNVEQVLSASSNVGGSYYDTLGKPPVSASGQPQDSSSWLGHGSAALSYLAGFKFFQANASVGGFSYYYPNREEPWYNAYTLNGAASGGYTWNLSRKARFSVNGSVTVQPAYAGYLLNGITGTADPSLILPPDATALQGEILSTQTGAVYTYDVSRRVSFGADYRHDRNWTFGREESANWVGHSTSPFVSVRITRHLSARGGYRFSATRRSSDLVEDEGYVTSHSADVSLDYSRGGTLQLTKQTTLAFGMGVGAATDSSGRQRYFGLGNVVINHEMGRTWTASAGYNRGLDFPSLLQEPTLTDNFFAHLGGLINSHLSFSSYAQYTRGAVGFGGGDDSFSTASAVAGVQSALNRYLALGVNYTYFYRSVGVDVVLPSDIVNYNQSQAVHVFLSAWAPLYSRARRPDATR